MGIASTVFLLILLFRPDMDEPIYYREKIESLSLCLAMAREMLTRAEEGPLRTEGGRFRAGCEIEAAPSIDH